MFAVCSALAIAVEPSLSTFSATAAFTGAATFALISDMAARSGSSSPARVFSSSRVSCLYSSCFLPMPTSLVGLVDRCGLRRVCICDRVVRQDVGGHGGVDRDRDVRVDQRHRGPLRELLPGELVQLFARQLRVLG